MQPILVVQKTDPLGIPVALNNPVAIDEKGIIIFHTSNGNLWKTDGTDVGTTSIYPINSTLPFYSQPFSVSGSLSFSDAINVNGIVFFPANNNQYGTELWKTDGTQLSTQLVKDINPVGSSLPGNFTKVNNTLFFTAADDGVDLDLWKSDGTVQGTQLVKDLNITPLSLTEVNGTLFFTGNNFGQLWKSDGTQQGTQVVLEDNLSPKNLTDVNGTLFFTTDENSDNLYNAGHDSLWKSNGTEQGTQLVKTFNITDTTNSNLYYGIENLIEINETLFFTTGDGIHGRELWKSDGTEQGTQLVKDINPPSVRNGTPINEGTVFHDLIDVNGTLFFTISFVNEVKQLWKSDGTEQGTEFLLDIGQSSNHELTNLNGILFLSAFADNRGRELWKSDGTKAGTVLVEDLNPRGNSFPNNLTVLNNDLFFNTNAEPGLSGPRIYKIDDNIEGDSLLNTPINRFQNSQRPGTYLFAGEAESGNIRQNFRNFVEEGVAFKVATQPADGLIAMTRFQNTAVPGTYLYAGEAESANIRKNFPNFVEEGVAFYAYDGNANKGVDFYRLQNTQQPGTYLFVGEAEKNNILANFPQFQLEGVAFEVGV